MTRLYFVTSNKNKFMEVKSIFEKTLPKIDLEMAKWEKIEIQSDSLDEIVSYATDYLMDQGYCNFFLEDAGLFIESLQGFPGPYSSYVYKTIGVEGILKLMRNKDNRKAYFLASIGLCWNNKKYLFSGKIDGVISYEARGSKGFGFDPIFIPIGERRTFAEMELEQKNQFSHRARAILNLINFLKKEI